MKKDTVLVAVCNQKGGVGKSTMTIMLAGYYHYLKGLNVAVIDCDYPQYSLVRMKEGICAPLSIANISSN